MHGGNICKEICICKHANVDESEEVLSGASKLHVRGGMKQLLNCARRCVCQVSSPAIRVPEPRIGRRIMIASTVDPRISVVEFLFDSDGPIFLFNSPSRELRHAVTHARHGLGILVIILGLMTGFKRRELFITHR